MLDDGRESERESQRRSTERVTLLFIAEVMGVVDDDEFRVRARQGVRVKQELHVKTHAFD